MRPGFKLTWIDWLQNLARFLFGEVSERENKPYLCYSKPFSVTVLKFCSFNYTVSILAVTRNYCAYKAKHLMDFP